MSAGKKIMEGLKQALAVARGDADEIARCRVTPSCGCVFCDLGMEPSWVNAEPVHYLPKENRYAECANPDCQSR